MPGIVEFPTIVQQAAQQFGAIFTNEPERCHFAEYLTGLLVAAKKNVSGINAEFAETTDQSCLNRWITEVAWDEQELNRQRLAWLQQKAQTRYAPNGVIPIDNTLVDHDGKLIEDVGYFLDHAEERHKIAHDYLIANYVCPSGKHYALEFRRFRKQAACEAKRAELEAREGGLAEASAKEQRLATFKNHTALCGELIDWVVEQEIPVTTRKKVTTSDRTQWYFTKTIWMPEVKQAVRVAILWPYWNSTEPKKILATNQTHWEITRVLRGYGQRCTGTETLHRDGKQHLGLGDCQMRSGEGQTRHTYLVLLAHSLLMAQLRQGRVSAWANETLMTIGEACRAALRETLGQTISWAIERATLDGWAPERIVAHLNLA